MEYTYDDTGNLKSRQDSRPGGTTAETYGYGVSAGPHALTSGPLGFGVHDPSGRQTSRPGQPLLTYTSYDLPKLIEDASGGSSTFSYSIDGRRVRKVNGARDVIKLGGLYERRVENGVTNHVFYLPGGGTIVGQVLCRRDGPL